MLEEVAGAEDRVGALALRDTQDLIERRAQGIATDTTDLGRETTERSVEVEIGEVDESHGSSGRQA
jgi:hypothetical protein